MAIGAGHVELAALLVKVFLAAFIGGNRTWIIRNLDVNDIAARGIGHVTGDMRDWSLLPLQFFLTVGFTALINSQLEGNDFPAIGIEVGIVLTDTNAIIFKAAAVSLAVCEWLVK